MSFQQGLSGLNASAKHLDAIGNNVANASTVGFKQSQAQFADMFAASLSGSGVAQIGTGTKVASVSQQFTQGNITTTSNPMDTAISGQGFFQLTDAAGATLYSRNGQFQLDKNGFMVNNQGHKLSGYMPNAAGVIVTGAPVPLQINPANLQPKATALATVGVNLNSAAAVPVTAAFNPAGPTSYTNSTSMSIYDSLGASHVGTMYFQRLPVTPTTSAAIIPAAATTATVATSAGLAIGNTITLPGAGAAGPATTLAAAPVVPNTTTTAELTSVAGLPVGSNLTFPGPVVATVTGIAGNVVTFAPALAAAPVAGGAVTSTLPLTATITGIAGNVLSFTPATTTATQAAASIASNAPSSSWNTYLTVDGVSVPATVAPAAATPLTTLTFNSLGALASTTPATTPVGTVISSALFPLSTTVSPTQALTFNFGSPTAGTTQYGSAFGVSTLTQDGYTSGQLNSTSTGADGVITGRYSNGQTRPLGQIVLANFTGAQGLQPVGNNEWVQTAASGNALVGAPGSSSLGVLQSSATEDSNVDLTAELVNMITAQRTYQANAQTIKTQDQLLQTIVSLR